MKSHIFSQGAYHSSCFDGSLMPRLRIQWCGKASQFQRQHCHVRSWRSCGRCSGRCWSHVCIQQHEPCLQKFTQLRLNVQNIKTYSTYIQKIFSTSVEMCGRSLVRSSRVRILGYLVFVLHSGFSVIQYHCVKESHDINKMSQTRTCVIVYHEIL